MSGFTMRVNNALQCIDYFYNATGDRVGHAEYDKLESMGGKPTNPAHNSWAYNMHQFYLLNKERGLIELRAG